MSGDVRAADVVPTCSHLSRDITGACFTCTRNAHERALMAQAWDEGYHRGVRDEAGDIERADNPYQNYPPVSGGDA